MEFGQKRMNLFRSPICWPISNRKVAPILAKLNFGTKKKRTPKQKFLKNAFLETETIKFGWKTMILPESPSHWPILNRKVALICLKLNSGAKKKRPPKRKFFKKCRFGGRNDGFWPKNDDPLIEAYLLTHFQSKSCTNLSKTKFWHKKKIEHRN